MSKIDLSKVYIFTYYQDVYGVMAQSKEDALAHFRQDEDTEHLDVEPEDILPLEEYVLNVLHREYEVVGVEEDEPE